MSAILFINMIMSKIQVRYPLMTKLMLAMLIILGLSLIITSSADAGRPRGGSASQTTTTCVNPGGNNAEVQLSPGQQCSDLGEGWREYSLDTGPEASEEEHGNVDGGGCGVETTVLGCSGAGGDPITRVFVEIFNFIAAGVGILAIAGIIMGGIQYATASGDSSKASQGVNVIVNAVIGLLLFIFMFALINWLVPGGLFS